MDWSISSAIAINDDLILGLGNNCLHYLFYISVSPEDISLPSDGLRVRHLADALSVLQTSERLQELSV